MSKKRDRQRDFPGGPVVKTSLSSAGFAGLIPGWKAKIPHALRSVPFSSVAQSCSTLRLHELQHARSPCPTPTPRAYPNSCPLSWWCHPTISSSVVPFSSCPQSFPASGSFQMRKHVLRPITKTSLVRNIVTNSIKTFKMVNTLKKKRIFKKGKRERD